MYATYYMRLIERNDNEDDPYEIIEKAADDKDVSDEEYEEIYELFLKITEEN